MKRILALYALVLLLSGCSAPQPEGEALIVHRIRLVRELRDEAGRRWPALLRPQCDVPMLYYTDSVCYAVNPTRALRDRLACRPMHEEEGLSIYKCARVDSLPFHMHTCLTFDDSTRFDYRSPVLLCSSPETTAQFVAGTDSDEAWALMALHEYTHGFQLMHPEFVREFEQHCLDFPQGPFRRHYQGTDWLRRLIDRENEALRAALAAGDTARRDSCLRLYLDTRAERRERMLRYNDPRMVEAERLYELMEGTARYVEATTGLRLGVYTEQDTWLDDPVRTTYFYTTGYNLMRVLELLGADTSRLFTEPGLDLTGLLAETLERQQR